MGEAAAKKAAALERDHAPAEVAEILNEMDKAEILKVAEMDKADILKDDEEKLAKIFKQIMHRGDGEDCGDAQMLKKYAEIAEILNGVNDAEKVAKIFHVSKMYLWDVPKILGVMDAEIDKMKIWWKLCDDSDDFHPSFKCRPILEKILQMDDAEQIAEILDSSVNEDGPAEAWQLLKEMDDAKKAAVLKEMDAENLAGCVAHQLKGSANIYMNMKGKMLKEFTNDAEMAAKIFHVAAISDVAQAILSLGNLEVAKILNVMDVKYVVGIWRDWDSHDYIFNLRGKAPVNMAKWPVLKEMGDAKKIAKIFDSFDVAQIVRILKGMDDAKKRRQSSRRWMQRKCRRSPMRCKDGVRTPTDVDECRLVFAASPTVFESDTAVSALLRIDARCKVHRAL